MSNILLTILFHPKNSQNKLRMSRAGFFARAPPRLLLHMSSKLHEFFTLRLKKYVTKVCLFFREYSELLSRPIVNMVDASIEIWFVGQSKKKKYMEKRHAFNENKKDSVLYTTANSPPLGCSSVF